MKQISINLILIFSAFTLNAQNIGIGTNTPEPSAKLHIESNNTGLLIPKIDLSTVTFPSPGPATGLMLWNTDAAFGKGIGLYHNYGTASVPTWLKSEGILQVTAGNGLLGGGTASNLVVNANANNGLTIDSIADAIQLGGALTETTTISQGENQMVFNLDGTGDFSVQDNGTDRFQVLDNGRIELPSTIDADGNTNTGVLEIGNSLRIDDNEIITNTNATLYLQQDNNGPLMVDNGTFRVNSPSNTVGIGSITDAKLTIITNDEPERFGQYLRKNQSTSGSHYGLFCVLNNNYTGSSTSTIGARFESRKYGATNSTIYGNFSLGYDYQTGTGTRTVYGSRSYAYVSSTSGVSNARALYGSVAGNPNNAWAGYFAGNVYASGSFTTSDKRLKSNIKEFKGALSKILQLDVKSYNFKTEKFPLLNLPKGQQVGLISQDVQKIFPNIVARADESTQFIPLENAIEMGLKYKQTEDENLVEVGKDVEILALDYTKLVPVLIKGMQEQQIQIELQDEKFKQLEKKFLDLQKQINNK